MKREHIILRLTQIWILFLIVGSLQPVRPRVMAVMHREIHWLAFAAAALLLLHLSRNRRQELRGVIATLLLGLSLEFLQHIIYGNVMEWRDVRDDTLAIASALALYLLAGVSKTFFLSMRSAAVHKSLQPTSEDSLVIATCISPSPPHSSSHS